VVSLQTLSLWGNNIGDVGCIALSEVLIVNTTIQALDISDCNITITGAVALCSALKVNTSLINLEIGGNLIGNELANLFGEVPFLQKLDISGMNIGNEGAIILSESLKKNKTLTKLDLSYNKIGESGAESLWRMLQGNTLLKKLGLIGTKGTPARKRVEDIKKLLTERIWIENIKPSLRVVLKYHNIGGGASIGVEDGIVEWLQYTIAYPQ